jgi:hypothetical protein
MAQPIWITPSGNLGTIAEGVFFQIPLLAYDPDNPDSRTAVYYLMLAGELPAGVQCTRTGLIEGTPQAISSLQGVPQEVARDVTSKFSVRAYTEKYVNGVEVIDRIADRTFEITVTGQDVPEFITPEGNIGTFYDGSLVNIQLEFSDQDPSDDVFIKVAAGQLPPGLTVTREGLISGFISPLSPVALPAGYDRDQQGFDQYPFDFATRSASTNYQFTLEVTDGKESNLRTFEIFVYSRASLRADTTDLTADNTFVTADEGPTRTPVLLNYEPTDIGIVRNDNFFAYKFNGFDFDDDQIEYILVDDSTIGNGIPPGMDLNIDTGWFYGYIPDLGLTQLDYQFGIRVRKSNQPDVISDTYTFTMSVVGQIDTDVVWLVEADLGTVNNGSTSVFYVAARNVGGRQLQYRLKLGDYPVPDSGVYNKLPQGLSLLPTGDIAGRVSFNTFALDNGTTTFDKDIRTRLVADETTFDLEYNFTVNAYSPDGLVSVFKTFTITVNRKYNEPYNNLYIKAMPPIADRELVNQLIQNSDIIPTNKVYRFTDPNFGVAKNVVYNHAFGINAATYEEYVSSLYENHYWKNLTLGQIETAQATNSQGQVIYEVVYSRIVDDQVNSQGLSVSKEVTLPYPVELEDSSVITTVYPNSLDNMRDQVIDVVGEVSGILPLWMTSKQTSGRVLGFVPAWVICYVKPGAANQIAYNIQTQYGVQLNRIDFEVDRYELDRLLSINWDPVADSTGGMWVPAANSTSFDINTHYRVTSIVPGTGYKIGDKIAVPGVQIGGSNQYNSIVITVQDINSTGGVTLVNIQGQGPLQQQGDTYLNIAGTNLIGTGTGARFNLVVASGIATVFDGNSMMFNAPVDKYTNTDQYDKYLVFPKRTILA